MTLYPRFKQPVRCISQRAYECLKPYTGPLLWKADENDPRRHGTNHEGLFYQLPTDEKQLLSIFGLSTPFHPDLTRFHKTIGMIPLMVRQPALEAINYTKRINDATPNVRLFLYGDPGHGKTHILTHLIHYLHSRQEHVIIHINEMKKFTRSPWEFDQSTSRTGRIDTPLNAAILLQQILTQNSRIFEDKKELLTCSQDYKWSSREVTKAGEPLVNVANHGINRVIHASDCVAVLFKELMLACDAGKIKLASFMNEVRFLFQREAGVLRHKDLKRILVEEITVARALRKLIKGNYKNGLVIAAGDDETSGKQNQTPQDIFDKIGWEHFDPFLPINVPKYSRKEFESCMNMYQDIGWLTRAESRTQEARDEIRFVSGMNPANVHYMCLAL